MDCSSSPTFLPFMEVHHFCQGHAYHFFRPVGSTNSWHRVVWEQWSLTKYSFILWLVVLGKFRTRDRLRFIHINPTCVFCRQEEESHNDLFFTCGWTCHLWDMIKSWLRMGKSMRTLNSALRRLHPMKKSMEAHMKRVSPGIVVYLIWEERNRRAFERTTRGAHNF